MREATISGVTGNRLGDVEPQEQFARMSAHAKRVGGDTIRRRERQTNGLSS